ncbi:MAG: DUF2490 domain-containing protein [Bacteroidia bacterium]
MKKSIFCLSLIFSLNTIAQTYYNDAQVWFNLYLEKKISKRFLIHLNQQDRWTKNVSQYTLGYADIGITLKLTRNIKILADYVYTEKRKKTDIFSTRHQYYVAIVLKQDIKRWRFSYRNMFQFQYNDPYTSSNGMIAYYYERSKFTIKYYATKRLNFYVAEELYTPLNNQQLKGLDRSRSFAGLFINITRKQQLEFYCMLQLQLQKGDWYKQHKSYPNDMLNHDYVYGIGYSIQF